MLFHATSHQSFSLKGGHGVLTVCNDVSVLCAHKGETGADESAHALTGKKWKTVLNPVEHMHGSCLQPVEPMVATFTGSPAQHANHGAMDPVDYLRLQTGFTVHILTTF